MWIADRDGVETFVLNVAGGRPADRIELRYRTAAEAMVTRSLVAGLYRSVEIHPWHFDDRTSGSEPQ